MPPSDDYKSLTQSMLLCLITFISNETNGVDSAVRSSVRPHGINQSSNKRIVACKMNQTLTHHVSVGFDIIKELHIREMCHVLQLIFKYFDEDTVASIELTSKDWKAAISCGDSPKLWNNLLHQKMAMFPLWERLNFNFPPSLDPAPNYLSSRKFFNKTQFTAETLKKNVLMFEYTRDLVQDSVNVKGVIGYVRYCLMKSFVIGEKFVALKWKSQIKIWNRHSLKVEEILDIASKKQNLQNFKFILWDDALLYTHDQQINLRNIVTRKAEEHKPPWMNPTNYINFLFASNGYLVIGVYVKNQKHFSHNVVIWKIKKPVEIEWEEFRMIPLTLDDYETSIDHRFVIFTHRIEQSQLICDVRKTSDPTTTVKILKFASVEGEDVSYKDGLLLITNLKADMMIVDVESGVSRTILQPNNDFATNCLGVVSVSIHCDYVCLMCDYVDEYSVLITKMQLWDFQTLKNPPADSPLQPFCYFQEAEVANMGKAVTFRADLFGLVFVTVSPIPQYLVNSLPYVIRVLNFLPNCNFCKKIKKKLRRCSRCKSAKYCDGICQNADWHHHKGLCNIIGTK